MPDTKSCTRSHSEQSFVSVKALAEADLQEMKPKSRASLRSGSKPRASSVPRKILVEGHEVLVLPRNPRRASSQPLSARHAHHQTPADMAARAQVLKQKLLSVKLDKGEATKISATHTSRKSPRTSAAGSESSTKKARPLVPVVPEKAEEKRGDFMDPDSSSSYTYCSTSSGSPDDEMAQTTQPQPTAPTTTQEVAENAHPKKMPRKQNHSQERPAPSAPSQEIATPRPDSNDKWDGKTRARPARPDDPGCGTQFQGKAPKSYPVASSPAPSQDLADPPILASAHVGSAALQPPTIGSRHIQILDEKVAKFLRIHKFRDDNNAEPGSWNLPLPLMRDAEGLCPLQRHCQLMDRFGVRKCDKGVFWKIVEMGEYKAVHLDRLTPYTAKPKETAIIHMLAQTKEATEMLAKVIEMGANPRLVSGFRDGEGVVKE